MNKKLLLAAILIIAYFLFQGQLTSWYNENIVDKLLSKANRGNGLFLLQIIIAGIALFEVWRFISLRKTIPNFIVYITVFVLFVYVKARYWDNHYLFFASTYITSFNYADTIFLLLAPILIISVVDKLRTVKEPIYKTMPFYIDIPVSLTANDKFNRASFAKQLADKIQSKLEEADSGSLAVGINGTWGSGKTSFFNLIKAQIDQKNRLIINFNPWRSSSPAKIIEDFFQLLVHDLGQHDRELSNDLAKYAKFLTEINENAITKGMKSVADFVFGEEPKEVYYTKINTSITKIKKQILIFIDDLDRLDKNEILEVLRIIRNTANFSSVVYVVAYDKSYVLEAVKGFNAYNHEQFLEKIFQFEFNLPEFDPALLRNSIKKMIKAKLSDPAAIALIDGAIEYSGNGRTNLTNRIIATQRDVVRLANSFLFEIQQVASEVNYVDFYLMQLLKLKYFNLYTTLSYHKEVFFIQEEAKIRLRLESERNHEITEIDRMLRLMHNNPAPVAGTPADDPILYSYMKAYPNSTLTEIDQDNIKEIVDALLTEKDFKAGWQSRDHKSFVFGHNFYKYFTIQQLAGDFSANELEMLRAGDYNAYLAKVNEWLADDNLFEELKDRLEKIVDFDTLQEWENHLKILIHIGKHQLIPYSFTGLNYKQILDTIAYPNPRNKPLRFFADEAAYTSYIAELFRSAADPYLFESHLLNGALVRVIDFPLTDAQIQDQLYAYLQAYGAAHHVVTPDIIHLQNLVVEKNNVINRAYPIQQRAENYLTEHYRSYMNACQLGGFITEYDPHGHYYMLNEAAYKRFYPTLEEFMAYLAAAPNIDQTSDCYLEFLAYTQTVAAGPRQAIQYNFQHLFKTSV